MMLWNQFSNFLAFLSFLYIYICLILYMKDKVRKNIEKVRKIIECKSLS